MPLPSNFTAAIRRRLCALRRFPATACIVGFALVCASCSGSSERDAGGKVLVLGLDGMDPGAIDLLMSEGKMPNFARLRQDGAYGRLISSRPILSPIIWTTVATGREPADHKIGHFVAVNDKTGEQIPVTSQMRGTKAFWNIASEAGKEVDVVGWWATWPAEDIEGTIVSDHTCYHFLFDEGSNTDPESEDVGVVTPASRRDEILDLVTRPGDLPFEELKRYANVSEDEFKRPFNFEDDLAHFKWALATAHSYTRIGLHLLEEDQPDALMVYIEGVDSSSHLFGHLFRNRGLGGELAGQEQRFGNTVERMYLLADQILGRYLDALDDDTTLVVLSDHGFQLGALHEDPSKTRDMRRVSERFHRIEGILYMYGNGVKRHARIDRPTLLDITPTLLALLGIEAAEDMPGRVLTEALERDVPLTRVASYETAGGRADANTATAPVDPAILAHLEALGYLDTASPTGERNLAAMHFEAGRYEQAAAEYKKLIAERPNDAALHASLAGALGALGRYEEALAALEVAQPLSPLNPEIYHNRAVILERQGKPQQAVDEYRKAVKYAPTYDPSKQALLRLTGSGDPNGPRTDAERLAARIADRASAAAKRGNYDEAMAELAEAERIAPDFALVHQYRANVAFLSGNIDVAVSALERALQLDPGNALFEKNLAHLRAQAAKTP